MSKVYIMKKSKGMTFIGMLFTMAAVIILGILALRITPVYLQHYSVVRALSVLGTMPNQDTSADTDSSEIAIKRSLMKQFEIDNIEDISEANISLAPGHHDTLIVTIQYQVTRPFIGNISLLFKFNDTQEVPLARE